MKGKEVRALVVVLSFFFILSMGCTQRYQHQVQERNRYIRELTREKDTIERDLNDMKMNESRLKQQADLEKQRADSLDAEAADLRAQLASREAPPQEGPDIDLERNQLAEEFAGSGIDVEVRSNNLVMVLPNRITFNSGSATLNSNGKEVLRRVGSLLNTRFASYPLSIEGHTDNQPIKKSGFKTNWRLSCERALSVLQFLQNDSGVNPTRMRVAGYGEHHPMTSNDNDAGRKKNRRVEIIILRG